MSPLVRWTVRAALAYAVAHVLVGVAVRGKL